MVLIEPGAYSTDIFTRNRRISRGVDAPGVYAPWVAGLEQLFEGAVDRVARDPAEVGAAIVRILEHRSPPLRYPIGPSASLRGVIRRFVPGRLMEAVFARLLARARALGKDSTA